MLSLMFFRIDRYSDWIVCVQITDQMYEAIFAWDLCVTVLTYFNPNVFYELALRQCVGLPVICLIEKNQRIPFDIADLRVIEYTLKPSPLFNGVYAEQVQQYRVQFCGS